MKWRLTYLFVWCCVVVVLVGVLESCVAVKQDIVEQKPRAIVIAEKPMIPMSDDILASEAGDFVAHLPKGWFLVNHESKGLYNVFAVATNPDYTLSMILSLMKRDEEIERFFQKEGLIGVAKQSFQRRVKRTKSSVKMIGTVQEVVSGTKEYSTYQYTDDNGATITRVAVCRSSLGNYYEMSMVEFTFSGKSLPTKTMIEQTFASVIAMVDF